MKSIVHAICAVATIGLGMWGLHEHIEYSGFVLFAGICWAFAA